MATSLTGLTPSTTYDALIKVGDNGPIDGTLKVLSDGLGNDLPIQASTTAVNFTGALTQSGNTLQPTLVSGTSIKTVNSTSLLGSGDIAVQPTLVSGTNIKTLNSVSLLGSGDIVLTANPSGVSGAIQFSNGSAFASDAANLFWDNTNKRLGIGTNAPVKTLNVVGGDVQIGNSLTSGNFNPATYRTFTIGSDYGSGALQIGNGTTGLMWGGLYANISNVAVYANSRDLTFETPVEAMRITSGRNVGIGETTPTSRLHIKGSGSTSATTSLLVQNSAGVSSLQVNDNCSVFNYGKGAKTGNAVFGLAALNSITSGDFNSAFGNQALGANTTANQNNAFGYQALAFTTTGGDNNAMGAACMLFNTSGSQNVAMGTTVMFNNSSGSQNTAIGYNALNANTTGSSNTALGHGTVSGNFSGSVILGRSATATASNQFVIGSSAYNAGAVTTATALQTKTWDVIINGVAEKILLA